MDIMLHDIELDIQFLCLCIHGIILLDKISSYLAHAVNIQVPHSNFRCIKLNTKSNFAINSKYRGILDFYWL